MTANARLRIFDLRETSDLTTDSSYPQQPSYSAPRISREPVGIPVVPRNRGH